MVTTLPDSERIRDLTTVRIDNPREIYCMFIPLGENSIIQLVELFRLRDDIKILNTDLYYIVEIEFRGFTIKFYSRGIVLLQRPTETNILGNLIPRVETTSKTIPLIIKDLVTEYHLSLISVLADFASIPVHNTIICQKINFLSNDNNSLEELAKNPSIEHFFGDIRSISQKPQEEVIIGTLGSIIRSANLKELLSYHTFNRALHLFLAKYNAQIEKVWNSLTEFDTLLDDFESYLRNDTLEVDPANKSFFSEGRRNTLYQTKSHVYQGLKNTDNFIVLTKFIEDSIDFTTDKYHQEKQSGTIAENAFHITKVLKVLADRTKHLKILSESFVARGRSLITRLESFDSEIAQRSSKMITLESGDHRTFSYGEKTSSEITLDIGKINLINPEILCSLFIPLGENAIIQLVDNFQARNDVKIRETDLYYKLEAEVDNYIVTFYSRGLITISSKFDSCNIRELVEEAKKLVSKIQSILRKLMPKYHLSLVDVLGDITAIPMHQTILFKEVEELHPHMNKEMFVKALAANEEINSFIGIPRSIDSKDYEDVIIGTTGSIIRSDDIDIFISYHAYNRAVHLFLARYNLLIEEVWNNLNECNELVDDFEKYIRSKAVTLNIERSELFSSKRRLKLSQTRFHVIHEIKSIGNFLVITNFIENSITFSIEKFTEILESGKVRRNSFHIRKVLRTLQDRATHLKIVSESFDARAKTLITRLELYDNEIAVETSHRAEKIALLENSWKRTFTHDLPPVKTRVDVNTVLIKSPKLIYSLYIPLGENSIIRLVDRFQQDKHEIVSTDLYYYITILEKEFEISFYSRGLVTVTIKLEDDILPNLIQLSNTTVTKIPNLLMGLLSEYNLSLLGVLGDISLIPIHETLLLNSFSKINDANYRLNEAENEEFRDEYLRGLSEEPQVLTFIGNPRSVDSRAHEDLIIGTKGSLVRSEEIDILISYHCYNRALHLFLEQYNLEIEKAWKTLKKSEYLVDMFDQSLKGALDEKILIKVGLTKSNRRKNLRVTRNAVISGVKYLDSFIALLSFIEGSIEFTIDKFSTVLEDGIQANSFHIRKVLRTLQDRGRHMKIVSTSLQTQGKNVFSRLDFFDTEISFDLAQRYQKIAWTISILFMLFSLIALIQRTF